LEGIMTALGILMWVAIGALIALIGVVIRGRRIYMAKSDPSVYGVWLDRECLVRKEGEMSRCIVVAVSHKGAVAVRSIEDGSGRHAKWIPKEKVPERVRWVRSGEWEE